MFLFNNFIRELLFENGGERVDAGRGAQFRPPGQVRSFGTWLSNLESSPDGPNDLLTSSKLLRGHVPELPVPAARPKKK